MIILQVIGIGLIFIGIFFAIQVQTFSFYRKSIIGDLERILKGRLKFTLFFLKLNGNWCGKKVGLTILPPNVKTSPGRIGEGELTIEYSSQSSFKLKIEKKKRRPVLNNINALLKDIDHGFIGRYFISTDNYELTNRYLSSLENQRAVSALLDAYNFKVIEVLPGRIFAKRKLSSNSDAVESVILDDLRILEQISNSVSKISTST